MQEKIRRARSFLLQLRRRHVFRVAVAYLVIGLALLEGSDILLPALDLPPWSGPLVIALIILGFPLAMALAWAFDITPEGVVRTSASDEPGPAHGAGVRDSIGVGLPPGGSARAGACPGAARRPGHRGPAPDQHGRRSRR